MKRPTFLICAGLFLLTAHCASIAGAAGEVEITKIEGHYLDRVINMVIEWQSTNPVVKARITVGREPREMLIDEYDNHRDTRGYHGTLTMQVPADPLASIPYTVQLEDELRQLSTLTSGKITPAVAVANPYQQAYPQGDDNWGRRSTSNSGYNTQAYQQPDARTGTLADRLIEIANRHDLAPSIDKIKVNVLSPDNVSFSSKANDDKLLREVRFKVYDRKGTLVGTQIVNGLGKVWQGSSQTFTLGGGTFRVAAQAVDSAGNTSKEESTSFELTGKVVELPAAQDPGAQLTGQTQWPAGQPATPGTTTTYPQQQQYDTNGQPYPAQGSYQQPTTYPQQQQYDANGQPYPAQGTYQQPTTTYPQQYDATGQPNPAPGTYQQPTTIYPQSSGSYQTPQQQPTTPTPIPGSPTPSWW